MKFGFFNKGETPAGTGELSPDAGATEVEAWLRGENDHVDAIVDRMAEAGVNFKDVLRLRHDHYDDATAFIEEFRAEYGADFTIDDVNEIFQTLNEGLPNAKFPPLGADIPSDRNGEQ